MSEPGTAIAGPARKVAVTTMSELDSIPVILGGPPDGGFRTQNLRPLLLQIGQAMRDLLECGSTTTIDLAAMPFSRQDEEDLRRHLGTGEVSATLNALGPTLIQETALPGVWLTEHKDADGRRLTLHLEVTRIPSILVASEEDIADGLKLLQGASKTVEEPPDSQR
jgi:hydrogenase-1 operon protein HyaF